jgi:hypothetical protein
MFDDNFWMVHKFTYGVLCATDIELVGTKRVPMVHMIELQVNAIVVIITMVKH